MAVAQSSRVLPAEASPLQNIAAVATSFSLPLAQPAFLKLSHYPCRRFPLDQEDVDQFNRISRFTYVVDDPAATLASELVVLTSAMKFNSVHSAGWLGFKPSAYTSPVRKKEKEKEKARAVRRAHINGTKEFIQRCVPSERKASTAG